MVLLKMPKVHGDYLGSQSVGEKGLGLDKEDAGDFWTRSGYDHGLPSIKLHGVVLMGLCVWFIISIGVLVSILEE